MTDSFSASTACRLLRKMSVLNLLLPECLMEFCKKTQLLSLRAKSYDVTTQMKALCLPVLTHGAICLSKFHKNAFGQIWRAELP